MKLKLLSRIEHNPLFQILVKKITALRKSPASQEEEMLD